MLSLFWESTIKKKIDNKKSTRFNWRTKDKNWCKIHACDKAVFLGSFKIWIFTISSSMLQLIHIFLYNIWAQKSLEGNRTISIFLNFSKIYVFFHRAAAAASYYSHTNNLSHHMSRYPQVGKLLLTLTFTVFESLGWDSPKLCSYRRTLALAKMQHMRETFMLTL